MVLRPSCCPMIGAHEQVSRYYNKPYHRPHLLLPHSVFHWKRRCTWHGIMCAWHPWEMCHAQCAHFNAPISNLYAGRSAIDLCKQPPSIHALRARLAFNTCKGRDYAIRRQCTCLLGALVILRNAKIVEGSICAQNCALFTYCGADHLCTHT